MQRSKALPSAPPAIVLGRTHSKLLVMDKEELITGFADEIKKRDEEIRMLRALLAQR